MQVIGFSGTLTVSQKKTIPKQLGGLENFHLIKHTPNRPYVFLIKKNAKVLMF